MGACCAASGVCVPSWAAFGEVGPTRPLPCAPRWPHSTVAATPSSTCPTRPWGWIVDGSRWGIKTPSWTSPAAALADLVENYRRDPWNDQPIHVEVWTEKDAITSVVAPTTARPGRRRVHHPDRTSDG